MGTFTFNATVTNTSGVATVYSGSGTIVDAPPVIDSVVVSPQSATAGTLRTFTITAHDPAGLALTYSLSAPGYTVTPGAQANVFTAVI